MRRSGSGPFAATSSTVNRTASTKKAKSRIRPCSTLSGVLEEDGEDDTEASPRCYVPREGTDANSTDVAEQSAGTAPSSQPEISAAMEAAAAVATAALSTAVEIESERLSPRGDAREGEMEEEDAVEKDTNASHSGGVNFDKMPTTRVASIHPDSDLYEGRMLSSNDESLQLNAEVQSYCPQEHFEASLKNVHVEDLAFPIEDSF